MKKKYALLLSFLFTGLIASNVFLFSLSENVDLESVLVSRVIDGDTFELEDGRKVRLANINTPEKKEIGFESAKSYLGILENKTIDLEVLEEDRYSRTLGRVYYLGEYVNLEIVERGLGNAFLVYGEEIREFGDSQEESVEAGRGLWNKSIYYGCLEIYIDQEEEFVKIKAVCENLEVENWILKDESTKKFIFPKIILSGELKIHSGSGENTETEIFWGQSGNVWNNDRDSLFLFDNGGGLVGYESYGY